MHTLVDGMHEAGEYTAELPGEGLPSGAYYCRITTQDGTISKPVVIVH